MNCTLDGVDLPDDAWWQDELTADWSPVTEALDRAIDDALIVEPFVVQGGRPITLYVHHLTRADLRRLCDRRTPGRVMTLVLPDARQFSVGWRYDVPPLQAKELLPPEVPPADSDLFDVTLYLREV